MNKYTFICERHSEYKTSEYERIKIDIIAESEIEAKEKISEFKISKGQLHYARIIDCKENVSMDTKCRRIDNKDDTLKLFIACLGAAISTTQMYIPNDNYYKKALESDVTQMLMKQ